MCTAPGDGANGDNSKSSVIDSLWSADDPSNGIIKHDVVYGTT